MNQLYRFLTPFLAAVLLASASVGSAAAAEAEAPPAGSEAGETAPETMSVAFPRGHAMLLGPRAMVFVQCSGAVASACEGTLVLKGAGGSHKVPYSIVSGASQALAIPLGDENAVERGSRAKVVARTLQLSGGLVRTSRVLRIS